MLVLLLRFSVIRHFLVALQISWACFAFLIVYVSVQTNAALSIYMEYVSEGSIHVLLGKHGPFKESLIRNYTALILSGLACMRGDIFTGGIHCLKLFSYSTYITKYNNHFIMIFMAGILKERIYLWPLTG